jgi:hypothetical protein
VGRLSREGSFGGSGAIQENIPESNHALEKEWSFASVDARRVNRRRPMQRDSQNKNPPAVVKFEGIQTLPQETAAKARARLAMEQQRLAMSGKMTVLKTKPSS